MKKGYKKTKTWLKKLPDGYRERALSQIDELWGAYIDEVESMAFAISHFCDWFESNEGYAFWTKVQDSYECEDIDLPPLPEPEATHCIDVDSPEPQGIDATLQERGNNYGEWADNSLFVEQMKSVLSSSVGYVDTPHYVTEAFEMIFVKMARAINGDHRHLDTYTDIKGYIELAEREVKNELAT